MDIRLYRNTKNLTNAYIKQGSGFEIQLLNWQDVPLSLKNTFLTVKIKISLQV